MNARLLPVAVLLATGLVSFSTGAPARAALGGVNACPAADPFVTPPQSPPVFPVIREADSLRVDIRITGTVPQPGLRAWGLELTFDDTKLKYEYTERSSFTNDTDWPLFSGQLVSGLTDRLKIQGAVTTEGPKKPGDPDVLAIAVFTLLDNTEAGPAAFETINFTDDFGDEPQFLQLDLAPCSLFLQFDNRGTGDVNGSGTLTPGDALCAAKANDEFDVLPADCIFVAGPPPNASNRAPIERYEADVNCNGLSTNVDADVIFDSFFCAATPVPCLANTVFCPAPGNVIHAATYRGTARDKALRFGPSEPASADRIRVPLQIRGSGDVLSFGLDFAHPAATQIAVERSGETRDWIGFASRPLGDDVVRVGGYDFAGLTLSGSQWSTLGYLVLPVDTAESEESSQRLRLVGSADDLDGIPLVREGAGELVSGGTTRLQLGAPQPNPTSGVTSIPFVVPAGPARAIAIDVFNVHGQVVRGLVHGLVAPGSHEVTWDGHDQAGNLVAAGAYFVRMRADTFQETRKLVRTR